MVTELKLRKAPADIKDDAALFGPDGLGIDSLDGTSAVVIEAEEHALARGAAAIATLAGWWSGVALEEWCPPTPVHAARAIIVLSRADEAVVAHLVEHGWAGVPVLLASPRSGDHDSVGGIALAAAVGALVKGSVDEALVVERASGRWTATRPGRAPVLAPP